MGPIGPDRCPSWARDPRTGATLAYFQLQQRTGAPDLQPTQSGLAQDEELQQALLPGSQTSPSAEPAGPGAPEPPHGSGAGQQAQLGQAAGQAAPAAEQRRDEPQASRPEAAAPLSDKGAGSPPGAGSLPALQAAASDPALEATDPSAGDDQQPNTEAKGAADSLDLDPKQLSPKRTPRVQAQVRRSLMPAAASAQEAGVGHTTPHTRRGYTVCLLIRRRTAPQA